MRKSWRNTYALDFRMRPKDKRVKKYTEQCTIRFSKEQYERILEVSILLGGQDISETVRELIDLAYALLESSQNITMFDIIMHFLPKIKEELVKAQQAFSEEEETTKEP